LGSKELKNDQRATLRKDLQEKHESGIPHFSVIPALAPTVFFLKMTAHKTCEGIRENLVRKLWNASFL
jgi:hypothetical protein